MYPIFWSIGKINIYSHGVMLALGILAGGFLAYLLARRQNLPTHFFLDTILYSVIGGIIGARLLYFILYNNQFMNWYEVFFVWYGGMVSFGGMLGGLLTAIIALKTQKQPIWRWFDLGIVGILVGWAIGRVGCLLNSDVVGFVTNSKLAIWGRWPITLFEGGWCILVALICFILILQKKWSLRPGLIFSLGLGLYGLGRFFSDFLKDETKLIWQINLSQIGDLLTFALALILILIIMKVRKEQYVRGIN